MYTLSYATLLLCIVLAPRSPQLQQRLGRSILRLPTGKNGTYEVCTLTLYCVAIVMRSEESMLRVVKICLFFKNVASILTFH